MYSDVKRTGRIIMSFAILAIIIACLGLFALSSYMVEQRSKEISIRLVMGASLKNIYGLLIQNFLIMVLISLVIAIPVAWYIMQKWIENYAYRIQISWDVFFLCRYNRDSYCDLNYQLSVGSGSIYKPGRKIEIEIFRFNTTDSLSEL